MDVLFWAVMFVIFVCAELATVQLVSIWLGLGALISMMIAFFTDFTFLAQLTVFILISAVSLLISVPMLRKRMHAPVVHTNSELEIGKNATVIEEINSDNGTGRVTLNGVDWNAVADDSSQIIPNGSIVTVKAVRGATLTVAAKDKSAAVR
ncbi:MAG: NfeD family protein [Ruminococcus sp.]|nr:NfeD family protein [Oscillospiraceae bacterium]